MLAKEFKLKSSEEIQSVLKLGRRARGNFVSCSYQQSATGHLRAAVVVSKKVSQTAIRRNSVRRKIFNYLQGQLKEDSKPLGDLVVMIFSIPEDENQLISDLSTCLKSLSLE